MITVDDIAKVVTDRLAAVASVGTAIPGGCYFGRGPDPTSSYPYGVFQVEAGAADLLFESHYLQSFNVPFSVYAPIGASGSDPNAVAEALLQALAGDSANTAFRSASLRNSSETILASRLSIPSGSYTDRLREARDVFQVGLEVTIDACGDRSVN